MPISMITPDAEHVERDAMLRTNLPVASGSRKYARFVPAGLLMSKPSGLVPANKEIVARIACTIPGSQAYIMMA